MTNDRGTAWSVTINNPTPTDEENISLARQKGWKVDGQKEMGAQGTLHYQLLVKTPQVRFSALKRTFPRAHIELARNVTALNKYVHKDDTRAGELVQSDEKYPSLQKVWDMFESWSCVDYKSARHLSPDGWLDEFDRFVAEYIERGYVLETIAVNPQIRSALKKFGFSIWLRSYERKSAKNDSQTDTDRQTPQNLVAGEGITKHAVEECDENEQMEGREETSESECPQEVQESGIDEP